VFSHDNHTPLLKALAGIMGLETLNGPEFEMNGTVYYSDMIPWILNGSLEENIVSENAFDQNKLIDVLGKVELYTEHHNTNMDVMIYCS
jgi:ABC-type uncharacterized transport system fused permease/ATPase subunit